MLTLSLPPPPLSLSLSLPPSLLSLTSLPSVSLPPSLSLLSLSLSLSLSLCVTIYLSLYYPRNATLFNPTLLKTRLETMRTRMLDDACDAENKSKKTKKIDVKPFK